VSATWSPFVVVIIVAGTGSGGDIHLYRGVIIFGSHRLDTAIPPVDDRPRLGSWEDMSFGTSRR
jgi:hypothetical protein